MKTKNRLKNELLILIVLIIFFCTINITLADCAIPSEEHKINLGINLCEGENATTKVNFSLSANSSELVQPTLEQPLRTESNLIIYIISFMLLIVIILTTTALTLLKRDDIPTDQAIIDYIEQALDAGYNKSAIKTALKVKFTSRVINHHMHLVNKKQNIRYKHPVDDSIQYDQATVQSVKEYIKNQKRYHFRDADIRDALLHYGYSRRLVKNLK